VELHPSRKTKSTQTKPAPQCHFFDPGAKPSLRGGKRKLTACARWRKCGPCVGRLVAGLWDLWWTMRHWKRYFSGYFTFPLSATFHQCFTLIHLSITDAVSSEQCISSLTNSKQTLHRAKGGFGW